MSVDHNETSNAYLEALKDAARSLKEPGVFYVGFPANGVPGIDKEEARLWLEEHYGVPYKIDGDLVIPVQGE